MIANPDNRHKKREREKTGSGHPQPHCAVQSTLPTINSSWCTIFKLKRNYCYFSCFLGAPSGA